MRDRLVCNLPVLFPALKKTQITLPTPNQFMQYHMMISYDYLGILHHAESFMTEDTLMQLTALISWDTVLQNTQ